MQRTSKSSRPFVFRWVVRGGGWADEPQRPRSTPIGVSGAPLQYLTPVRSRKAAKQACKSKRVSRDSSRRALVMLRSAAERSLR